MDIQKIILGRSPKNFRQIKTPNGIDKKSGAIIETPKIPNLFFMVMMKRFTFVNFFLFDKRLGKILEIIELTDFITISIKNEKKKLPTIPPREHTISVSKKLKPNTKTAVGIPAIPGFNAQAMNTAKNSLHEISNSIMIFLHKPNHRHLPIQEQYKTVRLVLHQLLQSKEYNFDEAYVF